MKVKQINISEYMHSKSRIRSNTVSELLKNRNVGPSLFERRKKHFKTEPRQYEEIESELNAKK